MKKRIKDNLKKIKILVLDVDGVLTNGQIVLDHQGEETKVFNVLDGFGMVLFRRCGHKTAIISARSAKAVTSRATDLEVDRIYQDANPKLDAYQSLLKEFNLKDEEVCFMGDDLPDLPLLKRVGFAVSVPNATQDIKKAAHYITKHRGGDGAVREVIELILKAQGKWKEVLERY